MLEVLWELFLWYLLYKLIFSFIIPVYRTTRQVKKQVREFQQRSAQYESATFTKQSSTTTAKPNKSDHRDDYIEFEEIK